MSLAGSAVAPVGAICPALTPVSYKRHRVSAGVISDAVWLYCRSRLSIRDIEDLLAQRRIEVGTEALRCWVTRFGTLVAANLRPRREEKQPMGIELVPAQPQHVDAIGRICFEAFKGVQERHGFEADFPSVDVAREVLGMMVERDDFYGVVALRDGQPVGSNFLSVMDVVAGVGPITIDTSCQGEGIGRVLMQNVIDYARRNNIQQVRLLQDSFNVRSLSLYASLGFDVREAVAFMQAAPAISADPTVRPVTKSDLPALEELSRRIYKNSRRNEVAAAAPYGFDAFVREQQGRITGYLIPGIFGHGIAETEDDALALISESARRLPPPSARFFCPLSEASLFRMAVNSGCRTMKVMNYMTAGPYDPPDRVWMPSVLC